MSNDQPTGITRPQPQQPPLRPVVQPSTMAAPSIPNLLSRLGGRGGSGPPRSGRGGRRGLGRGCGGTGSNFGRSHADKVGGGTAVTLDHDTVIQSTDADAALSRLSAVDIGLLDDPYAGFFAGDGGPGPRRLPIINRGTYTRTQALDRIILSFLTNDNDTPRQIVSLGAGTDTRCLRLLARPGAGAGAGAGSGASPGWTTTTDTADLLHNVVYHEIDFPAVSSKKRRILEAAPPLRSLLAEGGGIEDRTEEEATGPSWRAVLGRGNELWGHGLDLRALAAAESGSARPLPGLRPDVPTLVVSECCLCYLEPDTARAVLQYFHAQLAGHPLGVVLYEPIRPHDTFGRTMVANLAARGITMPTLAAYPDGAAQEARLRQDAGLTRVRHRAMDALWDAWVDEAEQARVNQLDGLDEVEEWQLLASHYVVAWGSRGQYFETAWAQLDEEKGRESGGGENH